MPSVRQSELDVLRAIDAAVDGNRSAPVTARAAMQSMGCLEQMDSLRGGPWGVPATPGGMLGRLRRLAGKGLVRELDAPAGRFVLTDAAIAALDRDPYTVDPTAQDVEA